MDLKLRAMSFRSYMHDMIDTTILFPNYNNGNVLHHTFDALRRNVDCTRVNLVVVDDGSEDDGVAVIKAEVARCDFANVEIIERRHEGIVVALNAGLEAVKTLYVVRIDGDAMVISEGWIDRIRMMLSNRQVGMVGGQTIFDNGILHSLGRCIVGDYGLHDVGTFPIEPVGRRTLDSNVWRPWRQFEDGPITEVDAVLATCIGFRLEDARSIGGFDMRFNPVWIEDDDFAFSMRRIGLKVIMDRGIRILHRVSLRGSRQPGVVKTGSVGSAKNLGARTLSINAIDRLFRHAINPVRVDFGSIRGQFCNGGTQWRTSILNGHYERWKEKWGFDPLNPDMEAIMDRYYDTEICWRYNPERFRIGRRLVSALQEIV